MLNVNALGLPFKPLVCNHPAPVMDGCVLYLDGRYGGNDPATQTWYDLSGNGNDGALTNFAYNHIFSGWTGQGLAFDGVDDYVEVPHNASLNMTNAITLSAWIKIPAKKTNDMYVLKKTSSFFIRIDRESEGNAISAFVFIGSRPEPRVRIVMPEVDTWYHIVATYDASGGAGNLKAYVNGSLSNSVTRTGNIDISTSDLMIGNDFNGIMRDVAIYNRALSQQEITQNYLATKCIMPLSHVQGAVLDLRGREGTNTPATTVWQDASGHGNHAELKNVAYTAGDGWTGEGLELDGVDSYGDCDVPDSFLADGKHTVEMWCNPADLGAYRGFIEVANKDDVNGSNGNRVGRIMSFGNNAVMYHAIFGSDLPPVEITLPLNEMVHLVGTYDGSTAKLYVNGVLKGSSSGVASVSIPAGKRILFVGRDLVPDRYFKGTIHNVRIYPKALSEAEVLQNYLATVNRHLFA